MIEIKRIHAWLALMVGIGVPVATSVSAYYSNQNDFVRKDDYRRLLDRVITKFDKIDKIAEDVAEIRGRLEGNKRR